MQAWFQVRLSLRVRHPPFEPNKLRIHTIVARVIFAPSNSLLLEILIIGNYFLFRQTFKLTVQHAFIIRITNIYFMKNLRQLKWQRAFHLKHFALLFDMPNSIYPI